MSGAYVAKPAVPPEEVPVVPTPPPGWDLDWTFPGPYPPGYTPAFTLPMTATAVIVPSGTAAVTGSLRDHVDHATNEPDAVILTATIEDEAVDLRFSGEGYASSISSDATFATLWNIAPNIEFDLTRSEEGKILTLTGTSAIDDTTVVGTVDITIYAYIFSLNLSGPANMAWDDTASVVVSLRDHGTLRTNEPTGSTLTWTATLDGVAVDLRFSGGAYSSSIESAYSDIGAYWGAEKDIEFDLTEDDVEKTIVLSVTGTAFGDELSDTIEIEIDPLPYVVSYSASSVAGEWIPTGGAIGCAPLIYLNVYRIPTPTQRDTARMNDSIATWDPETAPWVIEWNYDAAIRDQISENVLTAGDSTLAASCAACVSGKTYRIVFYASPGGTSWKKINGSITFSVSVVLSDDSVLNYSVVRNVVEDGPSVGAQLLIEVDTAELTWSG